MIRWPPKYLTFYSPYHDVPPYNSDPSDSRLGYSVRTYTACGILRYDVCCLLWWWRNFVVLRTYSSPIEKFGARKVCATNRESDIGSERPSSRKEPVQKQQKVCCFQLRTHDSQSSYVYLDSQGKSQQGLNNKTETSGQHRSQQVAYS